MGVFEQVGLGRGGAVSDGSIALLLKLKKAKNFVECKRLNPGDLVMHRMQLAMIVSINEHSACDLMNITLLHCENGVSGIVRAQHSRNDKEYTIVRRYNV